MNNKVATLKLLGGKAWVSALSLPQTIHAALPSFPPVRASGSSSVI